MVLLVWHYTTTCTGVGKTCRRGENRSWPSVSAESVDNEYWCLNNAFVYAFIMRLTVEERVLRPTFTFNIYIYTYSFSSVALFVVFSTRNVPPNFGNHHRSLGSIHSSLHGTRGGQTELTHGFVPVLWFSHLNRPTYAPHSYFIYLPPRPYNLSKWQSC